ncbi:DNA mismatch repair endonuclease MutL [Paenibacillus thermotolerans]|uniref:DNA mismatch repair endonuclease MutL n=1 Tax=Paenibacillus thermotolerans TaxID=3027807 RepID=UPI002368D0AC|nr:MULTISPECIES: DNA mismatch repair endonuclease MutL [unclassified Paenibacillus]
MGIIRVLDEHLANQIAAGEVVERPSSVVKELVENAVDAGSTTVDVTVEDGGIKLIRVVDNGSGMEPDDLRAAFQRHATSKIRTGKDLFAIRSLGFRGEALPSIAAVSRVECISSTGEGGLAYRIAIDGGAEQAFEPCAGLKGTDFRVNDLFFNTPARLKYMKTVQTELGHITDFMYRLALSRPDVAFRLHHNGTQLLDTLGGGELLNAIAAVYGTSTAKRMVPVRLDTPDYTIDGYIARPDVTRSNRSGITVVVNGRVVRNYGTAQAIVAGYHTLLPVHRFPLAVLHIRMEPGLVDVNVHPAKLEVRFSKELELSESITSAVRGALSRETLIPSGLSAPRERKPAAAQVVQEELKLYGAPAKKPGDGGQVWNKPAGSGGWKPASAPSAPSAPLSNTAPFSPPPQTASRPSYGGETRTRELRAAETERKLTPSEATRLLQAMAPAAPAVPSAAADSPEQTAAGERAARQEPMREAVREAAPGAAESDEGAVRFPKLHPIGQALGTYIVAQNETGVYLVDQHAAHERINYEYYFEKFGKGAGASQLTMLSHVLEFTPSESQTIRSRLPLLESVGVYLEPFGGNTFKVRAHPDWFPQGEETELIEEMSQWVLSEKSPDVAKIREASAIMCSCKASIKANQAQTIAAMEALLDRLAECRNPFTCPHGRPIVVHFSMRDLEKMFKRVM